MPDTPRGYHYPDPTDPNDVPADLQALAEDVDADVQAHVSAGDPHPVYETATEAAARIDEHVVEGHPVVTQHKPTRHIFVGAKATKNADQVVAGGAVSVAVPFQSEEFDTDGIHSTSSNTGRLTVPAGMTGYWRITFQATTLTADVLFFALQVNDVYQAAPDSLSRNTYTTILHLGAGDHVTIVVSNGTGAPHAISAAESFFMAEFLGV